MEKVRGFLSWGKWYVLAMGVFYAPYWVLITFYNLKDHNSILNEGYELVSGVLALFLRSE
jgi:hypothetical protein